MPAVLEEPVLRLTFNNMEKLKSFDEANISAFWAVFSKVKDNLENGRRLENMSWRLWYRLGSTSSTSSNPSSPSSPASPFPPSIITTESSFFKNTTTSAPLGRSHHTTINSASPAPSILKSVPRSSVAPVPAPNPAPVKKQQQQQYAPIPRPPPSPIASTTTTIIPASSSNQPTTAPVLPRVNTSLIVTRIPTAEQQLFQQQQPIQPFILPTVTNPPPRYVVVIPHPSDPHPPITTPQAIVTPSKVKFFISGSGTPSDDGMQQATTSALARASPVPPQTQKIVEDDEDGLEESDVGDESDFYSDEDDLYSEEEEEDDDEDIAEGEFYYSEDEKAAPPTIVKDPMFCKVGLAPPQSTAHMSSSLSSSIASTSTTSSYLPPRAFVSAVSSPAPVPTLLPRRNVSTKSLLSAQLESAGLRRGHPSLVKGLSRIGGCDVCDGVGSDAARSGDWSGVEGCGCEGGYEGVEERDVQFFERVEGGEDEGLFSESLRRNLITDRRMPFHIGGRQKGGRVTRAEGDPESFTSYYW